MVTCLWCGEPIRRSPSLSRYVTLKPFSEKICASCEHKLAPISPRHCKRCGRDLTQLPSQFIDEHDVCHDCLRWEEGAWRGILTSNRSLYTYNEFLKEMFARYKFRGDAAMVEGFREPLRRVYQKNFMKISVIIPIPLSSERLQERCFNQAELIAMLLNKPVTNALERVHHETKQSKKNREERLASQTSPFQATMGLENQSVLLVDDIYTTGATLRWAARTLKTEAGVTDVHSLTIAHG